MKKILIAAAVIIVVLFGVAAFRDGYTEESEGIITFGQTKTGLLAGEISTLENAKEMLAALCENRPDEAKKLMHKELPESYQNAIRQMTDYLAGRKVARMEVLEKNVNQIISASGKTKREQVTYEVELNDGNILYFNTVATLESFDPGFTCCEIILGVDRESLKQKLFNLSASVIKPGDAESFSEVQKMLLALSEKRTSDAMTLMHEDVAESYADAIAQLEEYFAGREVNVIKPMQSSVQNSITLTGKKSLEETYYAAHLIDGDLISLKVKYLSDKADSGFAIFYIGIGGVY